MNARQMGSIREYDRPADRIRQHRQADKRPLIIVEGPSDARLLREAFDGRYVLFPVGTRSIALDTARELYGWRVRNYACVVDRDFDNVVALCEATGLPIYAYENADLEAMLTLMDSFRVMMHEVGSAEKIKKIGGFKKLVETLQLAVLPIARLRAANAAMGWGLAFDSVDPAGKIDSHTISLRVESYCAALALTSPSAPALRTLVDYASGAEELASPPRCPRGSTPYFRGKDLLAAAGVALRNWVGSCERAATRMDHLARVLRAVATVPLRDTDWYRGLRRLLEGQGDMSSSTNPHKIPFSRQAQSRAVPESPARAESGTP